MANDVLGLPRRTPASRYTRVFTAFFVSGLCHGLAAYFATGGGVRAQMDFFMLQPVGILFEEAVISAGKRAGLKDSALWRVVGHAWTILWFTFTSRTMWNETDLFLFPWKPEDRLGLVDWLQKRMG